MAYELPPLGYEHDALEPHIDKETMALHHGKHHAAYTKKFNAAVEKHPALFEREAEALIADLESLPEEIREAVRDHGGGYVNHAFFWPLLKKGVEARGPLVEAIVKQWGSMEQFQEEFNAAAAGRFGSGWAWLVWDLEGAEGSQLRIMSTPNQESPLSEGKRPILCLDVWEHAYYLRYFNQRIEYIKNWWNIVNWQKANENYEKAMK